MIRQARSTSERNPSFFALARTEGERNLAWGERAVVDMRADAGPDAWTYIALLGGSDTLAFRLRVAQSHLRGDMLPSYWSEAILIRLTGATLAGAEAISVPLAQPPGPAYAPTENGVVGVPLSDFDDPARYPNIALIALPKAQAKILARVELFRRARSTFDALEHVLRWLAFAWGVARTPNPLHENYGIPSAGMLETVCAAEDVELTPGLESRASCPEAIWASALHWRDFFAKTGERRVPFGRYVIGHEYPIVEPEPPTPAPDGGGQEGRTAKASRGAGGRGRKPAGRGRRRAR
jgi:hypothetical protein